MRFAAGETVSPHSASECLQRTLLDRCWAVESDAVRADSVTAIDPKQFSAPVPMVDLHVHEDVENDILTVCYLF